MRYCSSRVVGYIGRSSALNELTYSPAHPPTHRKPTAPHSNRLVLLHPPLTHPSTHPPTLTERNSTGAVPWPTGTCACPSSPSPTPISPPTYQQPTDLIPTASSSSNPPTHPPTYPYREKFDWRGPLAYWNLCLSLFSFCGMIRTVPHLLNNITTLSFRDTVCTSAAKVGLPTHPPTHP